MLLKEAIHHANNIPVIIFIILIINILLTDGFHMLRTPLPTSIPILQRISTNPISNFPPLKWFIVISGSSGMVGITNKADITETPNSIYKPLLLRIALNPVFISCITFLIPVFAFYSYSFPVFL